MSCPCRCHAYGPGTMITCDVDTGSSGVPGKPSCSPCDGGPGGGRGPVELAAGSGPVDPPAAAAVVPPEQACVLPHGEQPAERAVGLLCRRHFGELDGRLREIEMLFALRDEVIVPGPAAGAPVSGGGFGSPAPGRIELMEITDPRMSVAEELPDVLGVLAGWVRCVFEERDWLPPGEAPSKVPMLHGPVCEVRFCGHASCVVIRNAWRRLYARRGDWEFRDGAWRLPGTMSWMVQLLRRERVWIAGQDWVDAYVSELRDVHRALARATGASMWAEPVGRCPNCRTPLFNDPGGADVVTCRRCRASWSGVAWLRLRLIFEQESGRQA